MNSTTQEDAADGVETLEDLYRVLDERDYEPLWTMKGALTPEPTTAMVPRLWRYDEVRSLIERAGGLISAEDAERRVLALRNPGTAEHEVARATDTLWAAMQMVLPGEVAPAHRHTPAALRYIVEGKGAYTAVDGRRCEMEVGDFVITPNWTWHEHGHEGEGPMIWLDGLDLSIVHAMHACFVERHEGPIPQQPMASAARRAGTLQPLLAEDHPAPTLVWKLADAERALAELADAEGNPFDDLILEYRDPATNASALPTMSAYIQQLRPATATRSHRHTASTVYHVIRGEGRSVIDGRAFDWAPGDTFVVPTWALHSHETADGALLFSFSDAPALRALGLLRERADA
ncbi:cupin domain-containing protein [Conexibacter stalactiti]|uniref:Cupin domain-containing protein n=1 Tax=Conexibacter stalactiti TaxID=1940611 RepID=A0ABU4HN12_9ACTN|nr:cupin domain-containing protein [Conexibacter stalactiti]MDW5593434.1 cupin domain-containing protein [Conexibacter stalactiti]MEC5034075.1 cupin domain-containing protein [Conexibacter stalactiti]